MGDHVTNEPKVPVPLSPTQIAFLLVVAVLTGSIYFIGMTESRSSKTVSVPGNSTTALEHEVQPNVIPAAVQAVKVPEVSVAYTTLNEAIDGYRSEMSDEHNALSEGARLLALWGLDKMSWKDLKTLTPTRSAKVMKNPDSERGKLICFSGTVVEISSQRIHDVELTTGGAADMQGNFYRFTNVRSSGEILERSGASMCGVVIGTMEYSNSAGGTTHAVQLVGMFDLPENRTLTRRR